MLNSDAQAMAGVLIPGRGALALCPHQRGGRARGQRRQRGLEEARRERLVRVQHRHRIAAARARLAIGRRQARVQRARPPVGLQPQ